MGWVKLISLETFSKQGKNVMTGERFEVGPLSSIQGTVCDLCLAIVLHRSAMECIVLSIDFILVGSSEKNIMSHS